MRTQPEELVRRAARQMAAAKAGYVAIARGLYADAYAPLGEKATVQMLEERSSALSAAQSPDQRAHDLPTWPIAEGTLRFIAVVVTSLVVRALLAALGS